MTRLIRRASPMLACALLVLAVLAGAGGCGSDKRSASADSGTSPVTSGFITFATGSPASAYWSDGEQTLYISDNDNNQIWRWTDAGGLVPLATTPDPGGEVDAGATLVGQIIELTDKMLVVVRFGKPGGGFGAVAWVKPDGTTGLVPEPTRP